MTDKEYRQFVEIERHLYSDYARSLKQIQNEYARQIMWLRIMGLMETWTIVDIYDR